MIHVTPGIKKSISASICVTYTESTNVSPTKDGLMNVLQLIIVLTTDDSEEITTYVDKYYTFLMADFIQTIHLM